jgi:hypothetical protein
MRIEASLYLQKRAIIALLRDTISEILNLSLAVEGGFLSREENATEREGVRQGLNSAVGARIEVM